MRCPLRQLKSDRRLHLRPQCMTGTRKRRHALDEEGGQAELSIEGYRLDSLAVNDDLLWRQDEDVGQIVG